MLKALFTGSVRPVFFLCGLSKVPASISGSPVAILHTYSHYSINCVVFTYGKCGANYIFSTHSFSSLKSHSVYIKLAIIPVLVAHRLEYSVVFAEECHSCIISKLVQWSCIIAIKAATTMHDSLRINCIRVNNNAKSNILKEEKGEGFFIIIIALHNKEMLEC